MSSGFLKILRKGGGVSSLENYFVGSVTRPRKRILPHRVSRIRNRKGWSAVAGRTTNKPRLKPTGVSSRIAFQRESQPR